MALRVSASPVEARAVIALGRAKAETLSNNPAFIALTEELADALLANGRLDRADIENIRKDFNGNQT